MKRKPSFLLITLALIFLIVICFQFLREEQTCIDRMTISWNEDSDSNHTYLFRNDKAYYAFLPAYASLENLTLHTDVGYTALLNGIPWENVSPETDRTYTLTIKNPWGISICEAPLILMQSQNISTLSIQLSNGTMHNIENREEESGRMVLTGADNCTLYRGDFEKFHIRGNHTANLPKKPFAIKFGQDVDLLGTGGYTTYCLVANADDESKLRNKLVYETAQELGLAHSPESMYVDLYVDNVYYGLYLLTEKIDVHTNRIDITPLQDLTQNLNYFNLKHYDSWSSTDSGTLRRGLNIPLNPPDITGGYLLELEVTYRMYDSSNTFISDSGQIVTIKYPAQCSADQVNYIADFYQKIENSVTDGTYTQYIDLESWAKFYLISEFFGQIDKTSIFFYKDRDSIDPKLYAGPVWDFDWSFGLFENYSQELDRNPYKRHFRWGLYGLLRDDPIFRDAVREIYITEFLPLLETFLPNAFDYYESQIAASYAMDKQRWDTLYIPPHGPYTGTLKGSLDVLKDWVSARTSFFQETIVENNDFVTLSFHTDDSGKPFESHSLSPNSYFSPTYTIPVREGYAFLGWYDSSGNPLTKNTIITEDISFYAKWEQQDSSPPVSQDSDHSGIKLFQMLTKKSNPEDFAVVFLFAGISLFVLYHFLNAFVLSILKQKKRGSKNGHTKITP